MANGGLMPTQRIAKHVVSAEMGIVPPSKKGCRSDSTTGISGAKPLKKQHQKFYL
jgi:hypothetical protein